MIIRDLYTEVQCSRRIGLVGILIGYVNYLLDAVGRRFIGGDHLCHLTVERLFVVLLRVRHDLPHLADRGILRPVRLFRLMHLQKSITVINKSNDSKELRKKKDCRNYFFVLRQVRTVGESFTAYFAGIRFFTWKKVKVILFFSSSKN